MKLKDYLSHLQEIADKNPEALNWDVIYAVDAESTWYKPISYKPTVGFYKHGEFFQKEEIENNSICIN